MKEWHPGAFRNHAGCAEPSWVEGSTTKEDIGGMTSWPWMDLGRMAYEKAHVLQHRLVALLLQECGDGLSADGPFPFDGVFLVLEHPPVFTLGKRGGREFLCVDEAWLAERGIPIVETERGGFITYHGPGQLIVYPVVRLRSLGVSVAELVSGLEEVMIRVLAQWGIEACRNDRNRGVWVGSRKIGSIGIHVRKGIAFHGMALNVNTDLTPFTWIEPCGLSGVSMTSIREMTGDEVPMALVRQRTIAAVENVFGVRLHEFPLESPTKNAWVPTVEEVLS